MTNETREQWLHRAVEALTPMFRDIGETVPTVRVSVGFPGGKSFRKVVGQCWSTAASSDGVSQIFVTPLRGGDHTIEVLGTLLHELIHAVDDCASGHRGNYVRIARSLGLTSPWTSTTIGPESHDQLAALAEELGAFPNAAMNPGEGVVKKQTTRMLKIACPGCGWTARTTAKWIEHGLPTCPCGDLMEVA